MCAGGGGALTRPPQPPQPKPDRTQPTHPTTPPPGTTPLIIAAESAVGIKEGGRTGLVAVTISACFGLSVFFAPFLQSIPQVGGEGCRVGVGG